MARKVETKIYIREIALCLVAVAVIELVFYLYSSDDFSAYVYIKSVVEVFMAPLFPGWRLIYPPIALAVIVGVFVVLRKINNRVARVGCVFALSVVWAILGFVTIFEYYQ